MFISYKEFMQTDYSVILEGIAIDKVNKEVKFDSSHEENVDTSIINPTYYNINGYEVISIFKRKSNQDKLDGTPLIYALKQLNGWTIDIESLKQIVKNGIKIIKKLDKQFDTIISIPSSNALNSKLLEISSDYIKHKKVINNFFTKLKASDVFMDYVDYGDMNENDRKKVVKCFENMTKNNNNIFSFKYLPSTLRYVVSKSIKVNDGFDEDDINGKDILIIDDSISSGSSFEHSVNGILETFEPKSITLLSLFSPLEQ